jgi:hypothetical protein
MIDAGPSLKAAEGLSSTDVIAYLVGNGWSARPSRVEGISILSKAVQGAEKPAELILPVKPGFEEEERRIADALRVIAQIEGHSELKVAGEIRVASEHVGQETQLHAFPLHRRRRRHQKSAARDAVAAKKELERE